jgi:hypothetical protein
MANAWDGDPVFINLYTSKVYGCPGSYGGDYAFHAWAYDFYLAVRGAGPAPAPTISALNPNTGPANTDVTVEITGTGFDSGASVMVGATKLSPVATPTPTDLSVLIPAADIAAAGPVQISVKNSDGQTSGSATFTAT